MNKRAMNLIAAVLALLLLQACTPSPEQSQTTDTQSTGTVTTDPTTIATEPTTEATVPPLSVEVWQGKPQHLSYEEYFSVDRSYERSYEVSEWFVMSGDSGFRFELRTNSVLTVVSDAYDGVYAVPGAESLQSYRLIGTDGVFAYLYDDASIIKVELASGTVTKLTEGMILDAHLCDKVVLYYATVEDGQVQVIRSYLPSGAMDVLCTVDTAPAFFSLYRPESALGDVSWMTVNPEMLPLLKAELANPDSTYKKNEHSDYTFVWEDKNALTGTKYTVELQQICFELQKNTGVHALMQGRYHCQDATVTQKTGVVDSCFYGSSYPHDHFSPEITHVDVAPAVMGDWTSLPGLQIQGVVTAGSLPQGTSYSTVASGILYLVNEGKVKTLLEQPVKDCADGTDAIYCITEANTILQVSFDGSLYNTIYAQEGSQLRFLSSNDCMLYILDGNKVLQIDLDNNRYRVLLEQTDIVEMYQIEEGRFYFAVAKGLFYQQYILDLESGEIEATHFL